MTNTADDREVIPAGKQPFFTYQHLIPIARFLVEERGHGLWPNEESVACYEWGFRHMNGLACHLTRFITEEDWLAVKEHFVLPDTIGYHGGIIQDNLNYIQFIGFERVICEDGVIPIEEWEARQRERG